MSHETVNKQLKVGSLVRVKRMGELGVVIGEWCRWTNSPSDICYVVFVKGKKVKAYEEGLVIIGDE